MRKFLLSVTLVALVAMMSFADVSAAQKVIIVNDAAHWNQRADEFSMEVLQLVNVERSKEGLSPLKFSKDLAASAYVFYGNGKARTHTRRKFSGRADFTKASS